MLSPLRIDSLTIIFLLNSIGKVWTTGPLLACVAVSFDWLRDDIASQSSLIGESLANDVLQNQIASLPQFALGLLDSEPLYNTLHYLVTLSQSVCLFPYVLHLGDHDKK